MMFITLNLINNTVQRLNVSSIDAYNSHIIHDTEEQVTAVYINNPELTVLFVKETPEQIDSMLTELYVTVKK